MQTAKYRVVSSLRSSTIKRTKETMSLACRKENVVIWSLLVFFPSSSKAFCSRLYYSHVFSTLKVPRYLPSISQGFTLRISDIYVPCVFWKVGSSYKHCRVSFLGSLATLGSLPKAQVSIFMPRVLVRFFYQRIECNELCKCNGMSMCFCSKVQYMKHSMRKGFTTRKVICSACNHSKSIIL